jgi:chloramphenicol-sensitive protein RarD
MATLCTGGGPPRQVGVGYAARPVNPDPTRSGAAYALLAYGAWGVAPAYWKALGSVPPLEILAHRVAWSVVFAAVLLCVGRRFGELRAAATRRGLAILLVTAALIAANWGIFIWAVAAGRIVATSIGYFLTPLVNVALGVAFLRERPSPLQWAALALGAVGVAVVGAGANGTWGISLALAVSFGVYGLLRKVAPVSSLAGFAIESALVAPVALAYLVWLDARGAGALGSADAATTALLVGAGVVTAAPLLWFAAAARRLPLTVLSQFQYLAPSTALVLAVAVYGEPFTRAHAMAFGAIWSGLALYAFDALRVQARSARY